MKRQTIRRIAIVVLIASLIGLLALLNQSMNVDPEVAHDPYETPSAMATPVVSATPTPSMPTPSQTPSASVSPRANPPKVSPKPATTPTPSARRCAQDIGAFRPAKYRIDGAKLQRTVDVTEQALEPDGSLPSVPNSGAWESAWWKDGAKPGDSQGVAYFSVHTYTDGKALGNKIGRDIRSGDIVKVYDHKGRVGACYEVKDVVTKPYQDVKGKFLEEISRRDGPAGMVIGLCWKSKEDWKKFQWGNWPLRRYVILESIE